MSDFHALELMVRRFWASTDTLSLVHAKWMYVSVLAPLAPSGKVYRFAVRSHAAIKRHLSLFIVLVPRIKTEAPGGQRC